MKELIKHIISKKLLFLEIVAIIFTVISNGFVLIIPYFISVMIDHYLATGDIDYGSFLYILITITAILPFDFAKEYLLEYIAEKIGYKLKNSLVSKIVIQGFEYIYQTKSEKIFTILTNDIDSIKRLFSLGIVSIFNAFAILLVSAYMIIRVNASLGVYIFLSVPIVFFILVSVFSQARKSFRISRKLLDGLNKIIDENIKGAMLIKVLVASRAEIRKFTSKNIENYQIGSRIIFVFSIIMSFLTLFTGYVNVLVMWKGGLEVIKESMTLGELTAFISYVTMFTTPLITIGFLTSSFGNAGISIERIMSILQAENTFENGTLNLKKFHKFEFRNVSFAPEYESKERTLLQDTSFTIDRGDKVGIIGVTGSGKSLCMKLLIRFLDPTNGIIYLNDQDLKEYDIVQLREKIGYVPQENFIFNGTVRENIDLGRGFSDEEIEKVANIAQAAEFIEKIDKKYDSNIGERGTTLSGGQKQRICIARALLNNPEILILDDSTSKLDINTEKKLIEAISANFKEITIVLISQKIVSIKDSDKILVFDQGRLIEQGTHDYLIKKSYIYNQIELSQNNYTG